MPHPSPLLSSARLPLTTLSLCVLSLAAPSLANANSDQGLSYGPRPGYLIDKLPDGALKDTLQSCAGQTPQRSLFSIGHRGAPLMFPEHTVESHRAAARMGAGILECDVTFTKDLALVCRHAQNDLHTTTDILVSDLADRCTLPFAPATADEDAKAECRTSDVTLDEFKSLTPKMDSRDKRATTAKAYQGGTASWRTTLYSDGAQIMTHQESIALFKSLGAKFTPELKTPVVDMPFDGFSRADYAQKLVDEYINAGVPASDVWLQSFDLDDIKYWIKETPEFGAQATYLDDRYSASDADEGLVDPQDPTTFKPSMQELADMGVNYIAPPIWMLLTLKDGEITPSPYAIAAKAAGLKIITWSMERSGDLSTGGGWYYQSIKPAIHDASAYYQVLDVLAQDVGVVGVFSDWPATVTYYANCMGL